MTATAILWPIFGHVALVFIIYFELVRRRFVAGKAGEVREKDFELVTSQSDSRFTGVVARNLINNFELPVLFHIVCLFIFVMNAVNWGAVSIAWLFIASRYAHSFEHLTKNRVRVRGLFFITSFAMTGLLWLYLAVTVLQAN